MRRFHLVNKNKKYLATSLCRSNIPSRISKIYFEEIILHELAKILPNRENLSSKKLMNVRYSFL